MVTEVEKTGRPNDKSARGDETALTIISPDWTLKK